MVPRTDHSIPSSKVMCDGGELHKPKPDLVTYAMRQRVDDNLAEIHRAYRENYRDHLRYAYARVRSVEVAQDIIQQAFTNVLTAAERGARIDNMRGFLNSCVHNLCVNHTQREQKHFSLESSPLDFIDESGTTPEVSTVESVELRDDWHRVESVLDRMAPNQRYAFIMAEVRGLAYEDIAKSMNRTVNSVRQLLARARQKVRTNIDIGSDWAGLPIPALKLKQVLVHDFQDGFDHTLGAFKDRVLQAQSWLTNFAQQSWDTVMQPAAPLIAGAVVFSLAVVPGGILNGQGDNASEPAPSWQGVHQQITRSQTVLHSDLSLNSRSTNRLSRLRTPDRVSDKPQPTQHGGHPSPAISSEGHKPADTNQPSAKPAGHNVTEENGPGGNNNDDPMPDPGPPGNNNTGGDSGNENEPFSTIEDPPIRSEGSDPADDVGSEDPRPLGSGSAAMSGSGTGIDGTGKALGRPGEDSGGDPGSYPDGNPEKRPDGNDGNDPGGNPGGNNTG